MRKHLNTAAYGRDWADADARAEKLQAAIDDLRDLLTKTQDGLELAIAMKTMGALGHDAEVSRWAVAAVNPRIVGERRREMSTSIKDGSVTCNKIPPGSITMTDHGNPKPELPTVSLAMHNGHPIDEAVSDYLTKLAAYVEKYMAYIEARHERGKGER